MAGELSQRWGSLPYIKASFSSTDFADLADAAASLYGGAAAAGGSTSSDTSGGAASCMLRQRTAAGERSAGSSAQAAPPAATTASVAVPEAVAALLDDLATEVRCQLANKHSARSPWAPRDLVRFARAYAALRHRTPKVAQMLDVLSSFCVHRIRSRHLNCLCRPGDLTGEGLGLLRSAV